MLTVFQIQNRKALPERKVKILTSPHLNMENLSHRDISHCRKSLSLECGKLTGAADMEDKFSDCKESPNGTSKVGESVKETNCLEDADEIPSVVTSKYWRQLVPCRYQMSA